MYDVDPSDYEFQTCRKCGATNDASYIHCRKCGNELSSSDEFFIPIWVVVGAIVLIVFFAAITVTGVVFEDAAWVATILLPISAILGVIGWVWLLIEAFKANVLWGIGCLIFPIVWLAFLIVHPGRAFKPFAVYVLSLFLLLAASFFVPIPTPF